SASSRVRGAGASSNMAAVCLVVASLSTLPQEPPARATHHGRGLNAYRSATRLANVLAGGLPLEIGVHAADFQRTIVQTTSHGLTDQLALDMLRDSVGGLAVKTPVKQKQEIALNIDGKRSRPREEGR
ncbi:MAG TPA: hypothetical protein VFD49_04490, partial [Candidatus Dormibacteraeota bacterium]|nr:hypothetical protein [Candidatus Dormibacteraeota bacterium]